MTRNIYLLGVTSGLIAGFLSFCYQQLYGYFINGYFNQIINLGGVLGACLLGSMLAACGYWLIRGWVYEGKELVFNGAYLILSFGSLAGPFGISLPVDIESPELFPGLTAPMHFFPLIAWLVLKPLFIKALLLSGEIK